MKFNKKGELSFLTIVSTLVIIFIFIFWFFIGFPNWRAEKITGYDYCAPHGYTSISFSVFDCVNTDDFGDYIGQYQTFKLNIFSGEILKVK